MIVRKKTGEIVGRKQPVLYQKPLAKKWISNYRTPFWKNTRGQTSLVFDNLKTKIKSRPPVLTNRLDLFRNLYTMTVPSSMYTSAYKTGLEIGPVALLKSLSASKTGQRLKPELVTVHGTDTKQKPLTMFNKITVPKSKQSQTSAVVASPALKKAQRVDYKPALATVTFSDIVQKKTAMVSVPSFSPTRSYIHKTPGFGLPWFPKRGLYGRGKMHYGGKRSKKKYKFRKFDIGSLLPGGKTT